MAAQSERHARLLRLVAIGEGSQNVDTLASAMGVSVKTIRRDIASLRRAGFPIDESTQSHGQKCYRLSKDALPSIRFTYDEALAMMLSRRAVMTYDGTLIGEAGESAFEKILTVLGPLEQEYLNRMIPRVHQSHVGSDYSDHSEIVEALTIGVEESRATFITYTSARSTEPVTYDIHPYGIAEHRGTLYVVGYSCHHNEIRTWKVDRMLDAAVTDFPFHRPPEFDLKEHFAGAFAVITGNEPVKVRVRFTGSAARYAQEKRMHPSQSVTVNPDGSAVTEFQLTSTIEIKSYILSFGAAAEVLAPESLREEVQQELQQALSIYTASQSKQGATRR